MIRIKKYNEKHLELLRFQNSVPNPVGIEEVLNLSHFKIRTPNTL
jgi:hypothetical protein